MAKMMERISELEERLRMLKAQQAKAAARERTLQSRRERAKDTRRKILLGAWVLRQLERGELSRAALQASLEAYLVRGEDRALFEWSASPAPPAASARTALGLPKNPG